MVIAGTLNDRSSVIWLHGRRLTVRRAAASHGDRRTELTVTPRGDDLLEFRAQPALERGAWKLELEYSGEVDTVGATGMFQRWVNGLPYIFTHFAPIYARRVFPCIDEPDSRAQWQLTLDLPKDRIAVSNTPVAADNTRGDRHRVEFEPTRPLPPHLVALSVGPFDIVSAGATNSGVPVHIYALKGSDSGVTYAAATTTRLLDQLETWFGTVFPYTKLDIVVVPPTSGFGESANPGLISVAQTDIELEAHPSWQRRIRWIRTASHELAHQWFGNLVSGAWWDDFWLSEGFAQWIETKMTGQFQPKWNVDLEELDTRASALAADATVTALRVRQPIEISDDILRSTDEVNHDKSTSILSAFSGYLGRTAFQNATRRYVAERAGRTGTSADFIAAVSRVANDDLAEAFATFLDQPGAPMIDMELVCGDGAPSVSFTQARFVRVGSIGPIEPTRWIIPVCIAYETAGQRGEACTILDSETETMIIDRDPAHVANDDSAQTGPTDTAPCPRWVMANARGNGYFYTRYSTAQIVALRDEAWPRLRPAERLAVFHDVVNSVLHEQGVTRLPLPLALSFVPKLIAAGDRFSIRAALSFTDQLARFVDDNQRNALEAWYRASFGPSARRIGLTPRDSEDLDAEVVRSALILATARLGRDTDLAKQAVQFARTWRQLPESIRDIVLDIATDADPETFERVRKELGSESNRDHRSIMIQALAHVRDPERYKTALVASLGPEIDVHETLAIIFGATTEATRSVALQFLRERAAEFAKRLPGDEAAWITATVAALLTSACNAKRRPEIIEYLRQNFAGRPGEEYLAKQHAERLDQCIASRGLLEPELRAWLSTPLEVPRPPAIITTGKRR